MTYIVKNALLIGFILLLTANAKAVVANGDPGPPRGEYDANRFDARGYVNTYEGLLDAYYGEGQESENQTHIAVHHNPEMQVEAEVQTESAAMVDEVVESISVEIEPIDIEPVSVEEAQTEKVQTEPELIKSEPVESIEAEAELIEPIPAEERQTEEIQTGPVESVEIKAEQTESQTAIEVAVPQEAVEKTEPSSIEAAAKALVPTEIIEAIHAGTYSSGAFRNGHTTILPASGKAMYYNPGVMEIVVGHRLEMGEIQLCEQCIGFAAMLLPGDLNRIVWIVLEDYTIEGPFLVVDMAAPHHVDGLIQRQWLIDVDYETAMRWGMNGPIWVTVVDQSLE